MHEINKWAVKILSRCRPGKRADTILREELRAATTLSAREKTEVANTVLACFRWLGWLDIDAPPERRIARARDLARQFADNPESISSTDLMARAAPLWVFEQVQASSEWLRALQTPPKLWLRSRPGKRDSLMQSLRDCALPKDGIPSSAIEYRGGADLFRTREFHGGEFEIQDISSQAAGCICAPDAGQKWWDACAGEGGKTLHLSDLMMNKGLILASDRSQRRLQSLRRRAARANVFNLRIKPWDGGVHLPEKTLFDGVLIDAPCSGIGTWQRNPESRWTTTLEDVFELAAIQEQLLSHAARAVKPGGKLVYAVCTMTRAETIDIASAFEQRHAEFEPLTEPGPFNEPASAQHWFWPHRHSGNGMYVAVWRRRA